MRYEDKMNDKKEELQIKTIGFRRDDFDEYKKLKKKDISIYLLHHIVNQHLQRNSKKIK